MEAAPIPPDPLAHQGLVHKIARGYAEIGRRFGLSYEDLVGEGQLGLLRAGQLFDPGHKTAFSTYASLWIKQAIQHAIRSASWPVRVPSWVIDELSAESKGKVTALSQRGKTPRRAECLAAAREILQAHVYHDSGPGELMLSETLAGRGRAADARLERSEQVERVLARRSRRRRSPPLAVWAGRDGAAGADGDRETAGGDVLARRAARERGDWAVAATKRKGVHMKLRDVFRRRVTVSPGLAWLVARGVRGSPIITLSSPSEANRWPTGVAIACSATQWLFRACPGSASESKWLNRFSRRPPVMADKRVEILGAAGNIETAEIVITGQTPLDQTENIAQAKEASGKRSGPPGFWWAVHNLIAHPLSELLWWCQLKTASAWVHDETVPLHDNSTDGRG